MTLSSAGTNFRRYSPTLEVITILQQGQRLAGQGCFFQECHLTAVHRDVHRLRMHKKQMKGDISPESQPASLRRECPEVRWLDSSPPRLWDCTTMLRVTPHLCGDLLLCPKEMMIAKDRWNLPLGKNLQTHDSTLCFYAATLASETWFWRNLVWERQVKLTI